MPCPISLKNYLGFIELKPEVGQRDVTCVIQTWTVGVEPLGQVIPAAASAGLRYFLRFAQLHPGSRRQGPTRGRRRPRDDFLQLVVVVDVVVVVAAAVVLAAAGLVEAADA